MFGSKLFLRGDFCQLTFFFFPPRPTLTSEVRDRALWMVGNDWNKHG